MTTNQADATPLSLRQQNALKLLLKGFPDTRVATELGISRETVCRWRHHDADFQAALEAERQRLLATEPEEATKQRIEVVIATPLLSLAGIKARLELKDRLILQDLSNYNEERTRLIQRLETDIEQAKYFLDTLSKDESVTQQVTLSTNAYKFELVQTLISILEELVDSPAMRETILTELAKRMTQ